MQIRIDIDVGQRHFAIRTKASEQTDLFEFFGEFVRERQFALL